MQMIRGTAALAAGALMLGGLAACGDEGEPEASSSTASPSEVERTSSSEPSSSSGSGSSSSSESSDAQRDDEVNELPAAAKKQTKEGAIAFNEFFQQQMGEALKTGDTATLEKYSQGCDACEEYIRVTNKNNEQGTKMDKNPNVVGTATATSRSDKGYRVEVEVQAKEYHEVLADGSRGRTADPVTYTVVTDTQWSGDHWVIRDSIITK